MPRVSSVQAVSRCGGSALAIVALVLGGCAGSGSGLRGVIQPASPDVVVMAWPAHGAPAPKAHETVHVVQAKGRFAPAIAVVGVGSTIVFENRDRVWHNAFSVSPQNHFDLGRYTGGDHRRVTLDQPGVLGVFCELHPDEAMQVVVVPAGWRTRADEHGRFSFGGLPRGSYVVRAWDPSRGEATTTVEVPGSAPTVLRFRNPPGGGTPRASN